VRQHPFSGRFVKKLLTMNLLSIGIDELLFGRCLWPIIAFVNIRQRKLIQRLLVKRHLLYSDNHRVVGN
jgi:hypothetical protein